MTKNLKYILIVFSVILCLVGFVGLQTNLSSKVYADGEPYIEFTASVEGESTKLIDIHQNSYGSVVVKYQIVHNDGINSILLVPSYNSSVFKVATVTASDETVYNIVVAETVLGAPTITNVAEQNEAVKILLESTGTNETPIFNGVNGENEYFLTITYDIISATNGTYNFGLNIEPYVVNETSVAYYIEGNEQKGEQTEVEIKINATAVTLVVMEESSITIGANEDSEEDEDEVNDYYSFTYTGSSATVSKVSELSQVSDNLVVEFTYTGAELQVSDFSIVWWASDKYAVKSGEEPLQASPATTGYYLVEITAPASGKYYGTSASRLVLIDKANLVITIDNKQSVYGEPLVALTSSATSELVASLNIVLSTEASSSSNVGNYDITGSCNASSLYNVSFVKGTYTIIAKAITITAQDQNATYTGAEPTVDQSKYTVTGVASISGVEIIKAPGVNVGSYTLTPSLSNSNYAVTAVNGIFTITSVGKNADYVKSFFSGDTVAYDTQNHDLLIVTNKPSWIGHSVENNVQKNAGTYQITVNIVVSAQDAKNYMDESLVGDQYFVATVDSEITRANLQITADNKTSAYGTTPVTLTPATVEGLGSDVINVVFTVKNGNEVIELTKTTPVGNYSIVPSATDTNYAYTYVNGTYSVTKANAVVTASANNVYYNRDLSYAVTANVNDVSLAGNCVITITNSNNVDVTNNAILDAGTYTVTATVAGTDNYFGATQTAQFTVSKVDLATPVVAYNYNTATWSVITADAGISGTGAKALVNGTTVSYSVAGASVTPDNGSCAYTATSAGTLVLTVSSDNANYNDVTVNLIAYSVTFADDVNSHSENPNDPSNMPEVQYVFSGEKAVAPATNPTLDGYSFTGWKLGANDFVFSTTSISSNITIDTSWSIAAFTITFKYFDEADSANVNVFTVEKAFGADVVVVEGMQPEKASPNVGYSYSFNNKWAYNNVEYAVDENSKLIVDEDNVLKVTGAMTFVACYNTVYAQFEITYMVKYDNGAYAQYGNVQQVAYLNDITYNTLTTDASWFKVDAWYQDTSRIVEAPAVMPNHDITVYGAIVFDIGTGDINGDASIDANDITLYRQWIVGGYTMEVVATGTEWATAQEFDDEVRYFITKVADINGDNSKDIRDISITRMAIVGGYNWDDENGYNVTGHEIIRNVNTNVLNTITGAVVAGKKVTLTGNVSSAEGLIEIETPYNVYVDLGGYTLTLESFSITSTSRSTITIVNGTIVTTDGITISAPYGNVVLNNVTGYDANGLVNLAAANHSLHFNGNVEFYRGVDTTVANPTPAEIKVEKGTHVVVEPQAKVVVEEIVVTENFVAPQVATEEHVITLDNFSTVTEEIQVVGTVIKNNNEISSLSELMTAVENGGSYILVEDIVYNGQVGFAKDFTLDLNGHTIRSANNIALAARNGATLTIKGEGNVMAQEACVMAFDASKVVINGGTYTSIDNFVIGTNGTPGRGGNTITINAGTFNGGITSAGYVACGIYVANNDTVVVNGGTFNVTNGVGILARSGNTTVGEDVVFDVSGNGALGKVGDSKVTVPSGEVIVLDKAAAYPGGVPTLANNSAYTVYTKEGVSTIADLRAVALAGGDITLLANISYSGQVVFSADATLYLNNKTLRSTNDVAIAVVNGATLTIKGEGNVIAQEACVMAFDGSEIIINGGTYNAIDNFVVGTNGTEGRGGNTITINAGTFNGTIVSAGYVACGIYVANSDTVIVNGGTFNVTNGVGILARAGQTTIGSNVVFNVTGNGSNGKVGDSRVVVPAGKVFVVDFKAGYPGLNIETFTFENGTNYEVTTLVENEQQLRKALVNGGNIKLMNDITVTGTAKADRLAITVDTNLDLNGKTIKSADGLEPTSNWSTLWVNNGAVANISNGTIGSCYDTNGVNSAPYGITVGLANETAGTVNLTNVNVCGGTSAVYVILGEANIYSGTYQVSPYIENNVENYEFLLNCLDANYIAGTAVINVYGGSFENFNPADCEAEGPHTNFRV